MRAESWDFVVAGSGAGGCAAAGRLAESGARTLLVETGGVARPADDAFAAVQRYYIEGGLQAALGDGLLPVPTGRALGGTTAINSGTCLRPPADILAGWESSSGGSFRADEFSVHVEEAWRLLKAKTAPEATMTESSRLFLDGLTKLGVPGGHRLDRADDGCEGRGMCCFVCPTEGKVTADRAFLSGVRGRENFSLRTKTSLESIETSRGGVRLVLRGEDGAPTAVACRGLVLACGTLATPYFLRRFRLGSGWRQAGRGLSLHPAAKVLSRFERKIEGWKGVPQGAGVVDPQDGAIRYEGVYVPPEMAALTLPLEGRALKGWLDDYARVAAFGFMIRDESRGRVDYPLGPEHPVIRYRMGAVDFSRMHRAALFTARVLFAAGARRVLLPFNAAGNELDDPRGLDAADFSAAGPAALQMMAFHPLGTCGLGRAVGWDQQAGPGVVVADGSVVPESLGVNPQVTIAALGLRAARLLLEGPKR